MNQVICGIELGPSIRREILQLHVEPIQDQKAKITYSLTSLRKQKKKPALFLYHGKLTSQLRYINEQLRCSVIRNDSIQICVLVNHHVMEVTSGAISQHEHALKWQGQDYFIVIIAGLFSSTAMLVMPSACPLTKSNSSWKLPSRLVYIKETENKEQHLLRINEQAYYRQLCSRDCQGWN